MTTDTDRAYRRRRILRQHSPNDLLPVEEVRRHLVALRIGGLSYRQIGQMAGVSPNHVWRLTCRTSRVRRDTAERILRVLAPR